MRLQRCKMLRQLYLFHSTYSCCCINCIWSVSSSVRLYAEVMVGESGRLQNDWSAGRSIGQPVGRTSQHLIFNLCQPFVKNFQCKHGLLSKYIYHQRYNSTSFIVHTWEKKTFDWNSFIDKIEKWSDGNRYFATKIFSKVIMVITWATKLRSRRLWSYLHMNLSRFTDIWYTYYSSIPSVWRRINRCQKISAVGC